MPFYTDGRVVKGSARGSFQSFPFGKKTFFDIVLAGRLHTHTGHGSETVTTADRWGGSPSRDIDDEGSTGLEGNRPPPPHHRSVKRSRTHPALRPSAPRTAAVRKKKNAADPSSERRRRHGIRARDALLPAVTVAAAPRHPVETLARTRATYPHETGTRCEWTSCLAVGVAGFFFFFGTKPASRRHLNSVRTAGKLRGKKKAIITTTKRPAHGEDTTDAREPKLRYGTGLTTAH